MSFETAATNDKALALLELKQGDRVLDVDCGHGRTIKRAAETVGGDGFVGGIDASEAMLRIATRRCQRLIDAGRAQLTLADSASIPYPDESFDKVVTVHTLYFWNDPRRHLRELHRVLRPEGRLVVGFHPRGMVTTRSCPESVYTLYEVGEVGSLLREVDFTDVSFQTSGRVALACARRESTVQHRA